MGRMAGAVAGGVPLGEHGLTLEGAWALPLMAGGAWSRREAEQDWRTDMSGIASFSRSQLLRLRGGRTH